MYYQVKYDLETKTRAQLLSVLEIALPTDKFQLVKQEVGRIFKDAIARIAVYDDAVLANKLDELWHDIAAKRSEGVVCSCGVWFEHKQHLTPDMSDELKALIESETVERCQKHIDKYK